MIRLLTVIFLLITLTHCTTITRQPPEKLQNQPPPSWTARKTNLSQINRFNLSGKIAIRTATEGGSATLNWSQQDKNFQIALAGPFGANAIKLNGNDHQVNLLTADGKKISASRAEDLLAQHWGYTLPVSSLQYWIRGIPVPNVPALMTWDQNNRLHSLVQQGTKVSFLQYNTFGNFDLPSKVEITNQQILTKIVIYEWNPIDTQPPSSAQ